MKQKQISSYPQLITHILGIDHKNNEQRHYNQIPYNNYVWNTYVKKFLSEFKGSEVTPEVKELVNNITLARDVTDYKILHTIEKLKEQIFSSEQVEKMLSNVKYLTEKGTKKEISVREYLEKKHNKEFLDVTDEEDKSGIDLKDSENLLYQVKSASNVYDPEGKNYILITSNCDMKVHPDLNVLVIESGSNIWMLNFKENVNKFEAKEDNKFLISYKKIYRAELLDESKAENPG
jgi:hypothetical protein